MLKSIASVAILAVTSLVIGSIVNNPVADDHVPIWSQQIDYEKHLATYKTAPSFDEPRALRADGRLCLDDEHHVFRLPRFQTEVEGWKRKLERVVVSFNDTRRVPMRVHLYEGSAVKTCVIADGYSDDPTMAIVVDTVYGYEEQPGDWHYPPEWDVWIDMGVVANEETAIFIDDNPGDAWKVGGDTGNDEYWQFNLDIETWVSLGGGGTVWFMGDDLSGGGICVLYYYRWDVLGE